MFARKHIAPMRYAPLLLLALLTGCATMVTGTSTAVSIDSTPQHASIKIDGQDYGNTPRTVKLDSERPHEVTLSMDGYESETIELHKTSSGWVAGNLLFGGVPGLIIDLATGGIHVLSPKNINSDLDEDQTAVSIQVRMDVDQDLPRIGTLEKVTK